MSSRVAAITMVRDGAFFLSRWVRWYGSQLGKENLFIIFDGQDQIPPAFTECCNVTVLPRVEGGVHEADRGRIDILSRFAAGLLERYRFVIGTDVDEFVTPDPALGMSLPEFLGSLPCEGRSSYSALGLDVVQRLPEEGPLDRSGSPILSQRSYAFLSTRYTKASVLCAPVAWGSGFHRTRKGNFHIAKGLYLFHFGCADYEAVAARMTDGDLKSRGWGRHLGKRNRLFRRAARALPRDWQRWVGMARVLQTLFRPPYAWNKPAMLGLRILVRIPERFSKLF